MNPMQFTGSLRLNFVAMALLFSAAMAGGQSLSEPSPQNVRQAVREYRQQHEIDIVRDYVRLLSIPNVASDTANIQANAQHISTQLQARGFQTKLLATAGSPHVVYGELKTPGARHTILWYAHYDGQPVDKTQWATDPWAPVLHEGAVDSKTVAVEALRSRDGFG